MTIPVFPTLIGLAYDVVRTPIWKTTTQENISGLEVRIALESYPRYQWDVTFNVLRSTSAYQEFQTLFGFFNSVNGGALPFLYTDADDNSVSAQAIGVGDGSTTNFQLVRSLGGFTEPVLAPNTVPNVYLNGVNGNATVQGFNHYGTASPGVLVFNTPPGNGVAITADMTYSWPCRFVDDKAAFNLFMNQAYAVKKLSFMSLKS